MTATGSTPTTGATVGEQIAQAIEAHEDELRKIGCTWGGGGPLKDAARIARTFTPSVVGAAVDEAAVAQEKAMHFAEHLDRLLERIVDYPRPDDEPLAEGYDDGFTRAIEEVETNLRYYIDGTMPRDCECEFGWRCPDCSARGVYGGKPTATIPTSPTEAVDEP